MFSYGPAFSDGILGWENVKMWIEFFWFICIGEYGLIQNAEKTWANVAYGLLTVGGFNGLNIKTNASKCSIVGIFLTKRITQRYPQY